MKFLTENEMLLKFLHFIRTNLNVQNNYDIFNEVDTCFGIPDLVLIEKTTNNQNVFIAFELKLNKWKKALAQAFKYKSFSNISFVILDLYYIESALKNITDFINANIGLASLDNQGNFLMYHMPKLDKPYAHHIHKQLFPLFNYKYIEDNANHNSQFAKTISDFHYILGKCNSV